MGEEIANAAMNALNAGADPEDIAILLNAIEGADFVWVEDEPEVLH